MTTYPPNTEVRCPICKHRLWDNNASFATKLRTLPTTDYAVPGSATLKCRCKTYLEFTTSTEQAA